MIRISTHVRGGRTPRGDYLVCMLSPENRMRFSSYVHYAAKAIGTTCNLASAPEAINSVLGEFAVALETGRGIVDEAAADRAIAYGDQLPAPPNSPEAA